MKILLTSDWHLGINLYQKKLIKEQAKFFEETFFPFLKESKPDLLIVAGDIFDKPLPDQESLLLYEEILKKLSFLKIPSFFILGNHDSKRTTLHKYFIELGGIYLIDNLKFFFSPYTFKDERGFYLNLYFLPYLPLDELLEEAKVPSSSFFYNSFIFYNLIIHLLSQLSLQEPAFLVGHFAVKECSFSGEEIKIKGFSEDYLLPWELFKDFTALFLGHLHKTQVLKGKIFYPGAPLPYSFENSSEKRGLLLLEWKEPKLFSHFISLSSPYDLTLIKGTYEEVQHFPKTENYVKVVLTEDYPIFKAFEKLKEIFPNLLSLEYERSERDEEFFLRDIDFSVENFSLDEKELFREFYQYIEKKEIDNRLWKVFEKYLEEFYHKEREEGRLCQ